MSAVINKAKRNYRFYLKLESLILVATSVLVWLVTGAGVFSFLCGALASFLPHCLFVYWVFFRYKNAINVNKITALYQGEALKWVATIILFVTTLKGYGDFSLLPFALGYFMMLLCNSLLPLIVKTKSE